MAHVYVQTQHSVVTVFCYGFAEVHVFYCERCIPVSWSAAYHSLPYMAQMQAASGGNISASVCVAQIMDGRGDTSAALKFWSKAAKLNHPEAQFRLGRVRHQGLSRPALQQC